MKLALLNIAVRLAAIAIYHVWLSWRLKQIADATLLPDVWRAIVGADDHQFV